MGRRLGETCRRVGVAARVAGRDALPRDPPQAPPMVTSGEAPPTVNALRRVRRGTSTERAKVKIAVPLPHARPR